MALKVLPEEMAEDPDHEGQEAAALEFLGPEGVVDWVRHPEYTYPTSFVRALVLERLGREDEARATYQIAVDALEAELVRVPDDFRLHGPLGYSYAALGRPEKALASAQRGVEIMPLEKDALLGVARLWELAAVNARLGNAEAALGHYRRLLDFSGAFSVPFLKLDAYMDPVRDHPDYQALVRSATSD